MNKEYDYIIAGAGASGLSLAWKLLQSPLCKKKVLIVDESLALENDKTWCFWDAGAPPFSDIIYKRWDKVEVSVFEKRFTQTLNEYPYYCLRSIDFQKNVLKAVQAHPSFDLLEAQILELSSEENTATLRTQQQVFRAPYIFQSIFNPWKNTHDRSRHPLLQHFLGWEVSLNKPLFQSDTFTLMDFDATFDEGIAFIYLLPWDEKSGLIEYTIFSDQLVPQEFYEEKISLYLSNRFNLSPIDYQIERRELGKIPMEDRPHQPWYKPRILNLGTPGGLTKPSTGYTFRRIQQHVDGVVQDLLSEQPPTPQEPSPQRFKAYDLWLLQIIHQHPKDALKVFSHLFQNNTMDDVFRFLGEESSLRQDLSIMSSVPYFPFLRAIWKSRKRIREI